MAEGEDAAVEEELLGEADDVGITDADCALDEGGELVGVPLMRKQSSLHVDQLTWRIQMWRKRSQIEIYW